MGWCFPAEDFSRFIVQYVGYIVQHILGDGSTIRFWQPAPDSAVGVFDGAFLPAAVWVAEEGFAWQGLVLCELQAIVQRDGFWLEWGDGRPKFLSDSGGGFAIGIIQDQQES